MAFVKFCILMLFVVNSAEFGNSALLTKIQPGNEMLQLLLEEIMIKSLVPYKCVAIMTDPMYYDIFEMKWFGKFKSLISFIMVHVEDSEDLLSPNNTTQKSLLLAKKSGCQLYIILLANGIQAARFLRFGDRYRVLDTRTKFILLFDNRLFEKKLYYLWTRIINVVFIKEYSGISGDGKKKTMPWFELITIPFPSPITSVLVPRRLDIWTYGRFRKGVDLFRDKTFDLNNQTLRVVTFAHTPGSRKTKISSKFSNNSGVGVMENTTYVYSGTEVEILNTVAKAMNFRCEIFEPKNADTELWGRKGIDSKYTGLIGEMVYTRADIALGDLYYIPTLLNLLDLSIPYNTECLTFLTPEALTDNTWKTLILPFSPFMWMAVIICLIVCCFIFHMLARFHNHVDTQSDEEETADKSYLHIKKKKIITLTMHPTMDKMDSNAKYTLMKEQYIPPIKEGKPIGLYQFTEPVNSVLYTYSMLLLVSLPKLPSGWALRIFTGWYWLYCLLLVVAYRASLTAILARPVPRVTIDTLQELIDSKLPCGSWGNINQEFFKTALDPATKQIGEHFETVNNSDEAIDRVADGRFAFYENSYFLKEALVKRQMRFQSWKSNSNQSFNAADIAKADRSLHIMTDCIMNMPISIGLQKNSPIKPRFDKHIRTVMEAGLIRKWLDDTMQTVLTAEIQTNSSEAKALMNMKKFVGALVELFIGYFISLITFMIEILYFQLVVKKNPNFNKYSRTIIIADKKSE